MSVVLIELLSPSGAAQLPINTPLCWTCCRWRPQAAMAAAATRCCHNPGVPTASFLQPASCHCCDVTMHQHTGLKGKRTQLPFGLTCGYMTFMIFNVESHLITVTEIRGNRCQIQGFPCHTFFQFHSVRSQAEITYTLAS